MKAPFALPVHLVNCMILAADQAFILDTQGMTDDEISFVIQACNHHDKLVELLSNLLGATELNLDNLEPETSDLVHQAGCYLADHFNR